MSSQLLTSGFGLVSRLFRVLFSVSLAMLPWWAAAEEFSSANFIVRDPVLHIASSTEMQSSSYRLIGTVGQISIGTSTSATFEVRGGFLYFPKATNPVVTATAGDAEVSLSWTASQGFLGWNVSGYNVGQATVSGGPYTFTSSLGNVLSHTATGLTNGTTYYFIVRAEDAFQNSIATSSEVSATPVAAAAPAPTPTPGGGGFIESLLRIFGIEVPVPPEFVILPPPRLPEGPCISAADLDCDGKVGLEDLSIFFYYASLPAPNPADFLGDGQVGIQDLSVLLSEWTERLVTFTPDNGLVVPPERREIREAPEEEFAALVPVTPPTEERPFERPRPEVLPPPYRVVILISIAVIAILVIVWRIFFRAASF